MTLSTDIYILDEVEPREVFEQCKDIVGISATAKFSDKQQTEWARDAEGNGIRDAEGQPVFVPGPGKPWSLSMDPGQGFAAWLLTTYRPGEPLLTMEQAAVHEDYCNVPGNEDYDTDEPDCDGNHHDRACWMKVNFDTQYTYSGPDGEGCGALHAKYIARLGAWLAARDVRWQWRNEFTGDVYDGLKGLDTLVENSVKAEAWFNNIVRPVIEAEAAAAGTELDWG